LKLDAWGLRPVAWSFLRLGLEAWSLKLVAIDQDPGAILGPAVAHDL